MNRLALTFVYGLLFLVWGTLVPGALGYALVSLGGFLMGIACFSKEPTKP